MADIRVLVADGQHLFAECLSLVLAQEPGLEVSPEQPRTGPEVVEAAVRHRTHVVVADYWIPGPGDGPALARELAGGGSATRVLLTSWTHGTQHAQAALEAGAAGFLPKSLSVAQLVEAIRRAHAGEPLVYGDELARLLDDMARRSEEAEDRWARLCSLTPREGQILQLLADGRPGAEVAADLGLAIGSFKNHVHRILRKLGVKTQVEAVTIARRERFLSTSGPAGTSPRSQAGPRHYWTP